jgi:hypothetical protein
MHGEAYAGGTNVSIFLSDPNERFHQFQNVPTTPYILVHILATYIER